MISIWAMLLPLVAAHGTREDAVSVVDRGIQTMGGYENLVRVTSAHKKGLSQFTLPEESDKWEGPYLTNYLDFDLTLDFAASKTDRKDQFRGVQSADWKRLVIARAFDGSQVKMTGIAALHSELEQREELGLSPCRTLLYAKRARDLTLLSVAKEGVELFDRVKFNLLGESVTLWLQRPFGKLDRIEAVGQRDGFWIFWGDVSSVTSYANWQRFKPGIWCPMNWTVTDNNVVCLQVSLTSLELSQTDGYDATRLDAEVQRLTPVARPRPQATLKWDDIAPGVQQLRGTFTTQVVVGPKGLTVFDAPNTSEFGEDLIADLLRRYPGKPIQAVVLTDLYWPHFGAVRAFVARGIPVYVAPGNEPLVRAMVAAPHKVRPDALEKNPLAMKLRTLTEPVTLRSSGRTIIVAPQQGWTSGRMLAAYVPDAKTLFCSDTIVFDSPVKLSSEAAALDVVDLVRRMKWDVTTVFAQHAGATEWSKVLAVLGVAKG